MRERLERRVFVGRQLKSEDVWANQLLPDLLGEVL